MLWTYLQYLVLVNSPDKAGRCSTVTAAEHLFADNRKPQGYTSFRSVVRMSVGLDHKRFVALCHCAALGLH